MADLLFDLAANPEAVAHALGMDAGDCPLPDDDHAGRAWLEVRASRLTLRCDCRQVEGAPPCESWTSLGDVYRAVVTGTPIRVRSGRVGKQPRHVRLRWVLLLAHRAGLLKPAPLGPLPAKPTDTMRAVAEDLGLLLGARRRRGDTGPQDYACRFGADRHGVSHRTIGRALEALCDAGTIRRVDDGGHAILTTEGPRRKTGLYVEPCWRPASPSGVERAVRQPLVAGMELVGVGAVEPALEVAHQHQMAATEVEDHPGAGLTTAEGGAGLHGLEDAIAGGRS